MNLPKNCIATKALLFLVALLAATLAYASGPAGTVTHLSGPLLLKKADGTVKILSQKSTVEQGDTLITEKDTYARIKFVDNSEITLRPNSQLKIDSFSFEQEKPEKDSATFSLVKGGLRAITGALGKRSQERVGVNTPAATIGIRGTTFIAEYVPPESDPVAAYAYAFASVAAAPDLLSSTYGTMTDAPQSGPPAAILPLRLAQNFPGLPSSPRAGGLPPGLYVHVVDGMINLSNGAGKQNFSAGQFGFTPSFRQPPVVLPSNPGLRFTPPPAFKPSAGPGSATGGGNSADVDCEVR